MEKSTGRRFWERTGGAVLAAALMAPGWGFAAQPVPGGAATSPPIADLAHVAIAVGDVERSRTFYNKLGFEEAFHFGEGGAITQSFLKVNDRQFIELYPLKSMKGTHIAGFLHLCFDGDDLLALNRFYLGEGLLPNEVRKARAGNLLFTMEGPEAQNLEYTQYLPGSLHYEDRGKHLGAGRPADSFFAVSVSMKDRDAARTYYRQKLGFSEVKGHPYLFVIPGSSRQEVLLDSSALGRRSRIFLHVDDLRKTRDLLKGHGIGTSDIRGDVVVTDPDGNLLVFTRSQVASADPVSP